MRRKHRIAGGAAIFLIAVAAAIGVRYSQSKAAVLAPPPPEVLVATAEPKDLPIEREWVGTLDGLVNAAIKAEVTGYLLKQDYSEGSFVRKGQLLFEIDPRPFQAAADQASAQLSQAKAQVSQSRAGLVQAEAQLTSAEANQRKAQLDEEKYSPLAKEQAVTQQEVDNAVQTNQSQKAQVGAAKAQVDLGFTRITSLIDGIAGVATVQVGNLVGPAANAVTTVSTLDPVKANFTVSEQEYLSLARADALHHLQLQLVLADGTVHPHGGRFSFADRQVDPGTGTIQ